MQKPLKDALDSFARTTGHRSVDQILHAPSAHADYQPGQRQFARQQALYSPPLEASPAPFMSWTAPIAGAAALVLFMVAAFYAAGHLATVLHGVISWHN